MKGWDVNLLCIKCGRPVRHTHQNGFYCQPVKGRPWARHVGPCPLEAEK